ncbi:MAG: metallophosphoesterase family protein [Bacteroidota bacterium]
MNRFAISDIHGCLKTFKALLEKINFSKADELFLLGDYIDRGPDSKGVIDHILELKAKGYLVHCLMGNHEELMIRGLKGDELALDIWLKNGGYQTIDSYFEDDAKDIPVEHLIFLNNLKYYFKIDHYYLVHAGLNFKLGEPLSDEKSMLWIRDWYGDLDQQWLGRRSIVHGHTPLPKAVIKQQHLELKNFPVLDIDCGCVYNRMGLGYLCAFNLNTKSLTFQKNIENS